MPLGHLKVDAQESASLNVYGGQEGGPGVGTDDPEEKAPQKAGEKVN